MMTQHPKGPAAGLVVGLPQLQKQIKVLPCLSRISIGFLFLAGVCLCGLANSSSNTYKVQAEFKIYNNGPSDKVQILRYDCDLMVSGNLWRIESVDDVLGSGMNYRRRSTGTDGTNVFAAGCFTPTFDLLSEGTNAFGSVVPQLCPSDHFLRLLLLAYVPDPAIQGTTHGTNCPLFWPFDTAIWKKTLCSLQATNFPAPPYLPYEIKFFKPKKNTPTENYLAAVYRVISFSEQDGLILPTSFELQKFFEDKIAYPKPTQIVLAKAKKVTVLTSTNTEFIPHPAHGSVVNDFRFNGHSNRVRYLHYTNRAETWGSLSDTNLHRVFKSQYAKRTIPSEQPKVSPLYALTIVSILTIVTIYSMYKINKRNKYI